MNFNPYEADRVTCAKSRDIRQPTCGKGDGNDARGRTEHRCAYG